MDTIQAARKVLHDAEQYLRELIEKALAEQRYGEIKEVADLADGVAKLIRGETGVSERVGRVTEPALQYRLSEAPPRPSRAVKATPKRNAPRKSRYPWFRRDGDRLVKIGWSKKNKKEYEHRVQREAVLTFIRHLVDRVNEGELFDVEGLLPVTDMSGEEVPAYQVYVTLAWLRDANVIEKKGRDGYVLRDKSILSGEIDELWNSLRARAA